MLKNLVYNILTRLRQNTEPNIVLIIVNNVVKPIYDIYYAW